VDGLEIFVILH